MNNKEMEVRFEKQDYDLRSLKKQTLLPSGN
jgi:hypothetical protein